MSHHPAIEIKQASLEDASKLLPLLTQFFYDEGFDAVVKKLPTALDAMLQDSGSAIFFASNRVEVIGIATVTTTSVGLEFSRYAELEDLYVLPQSRNQGVGQALIDKVKQWCCQKQYSVLSVVVTPEDQANRNLISYYQKKGFHESERFTLFYYFNSSQV
ncbi:GNAT family N-acetyltransferase [Nostoc sp. FACHB-110]|uniref:GNAT family N-acetyltransferase n=1 Tax=Nostoc sp. FACHB-110 TaxID=2692834 RepID=UPI00168286FD|nr:GNAT family N-acetyltransferase [Nostoc sp. FACHB-110]MBD2438155.1 GNAT family N-acetyltransferase [Nostoc sp. FACHB-110]